MARTYGYEVLLFGSHRTRTDIGNDLTERGARGWRVVAGGRDDDGSWSFVLEREESVEAPRDRSDVGDV